MLTRIEIDGFKTFRDFALDVPPFLVVLGRNASGKSNLFDAIDLLHRTADRSLSEAVADSRGDLYELLHTAIDGTRSPTMTFAVEVLLDSRVADDFGDATEVSHSRVRYELALTLRPPTGTASNGRRERLYVDHESVTLIRKARDTWVKQHIHDPAVRDNLVRYSTRPPEMLDTRTDENGRPVFHLHQEGKAGRSRTNPAAEAVSTILSSLTTVNDFPLLFALKRELESWGLLHLDPAALRTVSSFDDEESLAQNGANLANTLHRIEVLTADDDRPRGVLADLAAEVAEIVPEIVDLEIDEDAARRQRQVVVRTRDDAPYTSRVASDGTLRVLALLTVLHDPERRGLICFEEPENGIYPQRLIDFITRLRDLAYASLDRRATYADAPLLQLLLSSHTPVVLGALPRSDSVSGRRNGVVFFDTVARIDGKRRSRITRHRAIRSDDQGAFRGDEDSPTVAHAEIDIFEIFDALGER